VNVYWIFCTQCRLFSEFTSLREIRPRGREGSVMNQLPRHENTGETGHKFYSGNRIMFLHSMNYICLSGRSSNNSVALRADFP
jgi:hypothetical protein